MDRKSDPLRIFRVIQEMDADIVGLQEAVFPFPVDGASAEEILRRRMGYELLHGATMLRENVPYGNALLTRHPVRSVGRIDLTVGVREPRGALSVNLDIQGTEFLVIVTHLGLQESERHRQIEKLFRVSMDHWSGMTVLLGDFNEWIPRARCSRRLVRHFGPTPAPRTFPSRLPLLRLDRIWVQPGKALRHVWVYRTSLAQTASDHLPVIGKIFWQRQERTQQALSNAPSV